MLDTFLHQFPGTFFVLAMLLPLASFVLILLASAGWAGIRPYRDSKWGEPLFRLLGGDRGGRGAGILATAAIFLAFLASLTGFFTFLIDDYAVKRAPDDLRAHRMMLIVENKDIQTDDDRLKTLADKELEDAKAKHARLVKERDDLVERIAFEESLATRMQTGYSARFDWLRVTPAGLPDPEKGTVLQVGYRIDHLSSLMFVMVTFVALLIHLFSTVYMQGEQAETVHDHHVSANSEDGFLHRRGRYGRFYMYLSLFCFSMLSLLLADNLFQAFVSWELVGICSYLLIGFYYERTNAANAANKAFLVNRLGDAGFIVGLLILWTSIGTFNFEDLFSRIRTPRSYEIGNALILRHDGFFRVQRDDKRLIIDDDGPDVALAPRQPGGGLMHFDRSDDHPALPSTGQPNTYGSMPYWLLTLAGLGIFAGCVSKSAQFPLQVWLPDAMAGPTPVSALIHAATMVAAGVYMVGRCYPLFTPEVLLVIAYTGAITLFIAATTALVMTDIKKVLAWSTVSQLGYMMLALGVGGWAAAMFHLLTHAFFKALLFLGCGSVIHGCHHEQEMIKMGGLGKKMPITAVTMLVGVLAIVGFPLFSGWYSKDAILTAAWSFVTEHRQHTFLFLVPLVTVSLTAFYMFRLWFLTFTGEPRHADIHHQAEESPSTMLIPLILLAILSIGIGWGWPVWDTDASWLKSLLQGAQPASVAADFHRSHEAGYGHMLVALLALGMAALGLLFALLLYYYRTMNSAEARQQFPGVHAFLVHKWYFDEVYWAIIAQPVLVVGRWILAFDRVVLDGLVHGLARVVTGLSRWDGFFDRYFVDGLVNQVGSVVSAVGGWLRRWETGSLRNYVLFLVLAAVGIFLMLASL